VKALLLARDFVLTLLVLPFLLPLYLLPWRAALALGRLYGFLGYLAWPVARRAGMVNLKRAFGSVLTRRDAHRSVRKVFQNLGQSLAEGIQFARRRHRDRDSGWESLVAVEDPAAEARLLADPRPKIFVTGHLGSREVAMQVAESRMGERGAAIVRRVDNPFLNALVRRLRLRHPDQWIEKRGAVGEALARLRAGDSVALLFDENGSKRGPFLPFFGRPASTRKTAALLSVLTGAPLVVGAVVRRPGNHPFLFRLSVVEPPARKAVPGDVEILTRRLLEVWEGWVREDPLQWRWIHWRWRSRPEGLEETYTRRDVDAAFADLAATSATSGERITA
jgi:Kdo2-lipid IVA lauroyltransferase/acyltransferase